jgi:hypothetical protein
MAARWPPPLPPPPCPLAALMEAPYGQGDGAGGPPPPCKQDLRPCEKCQTASYIKKGQCVNMYCVGASEPFCENALVRKGTCENA